MFDDSAEQEQQRPQRPTTPEGDSIFRVPEGNMAKLGDKVDRMNRRAKRLGMEPLTLKEIGEEFADFEKKDHDGKKITYTVRYVLVTLTGKLPRINGWQFVATIQHDEEGNIIRTVPGVKLQLPLRYRTMGTGCDHCMTMRKRNDTYVLHSEEKGWMRVGRNCLADFLRCENAAGMAEYAELLADIEASMGDMEGGEEGGCHTGPNWYRTLTYLAQVANVIRVDGWCSRTEARDSWDVRKTATADWALRLFDPNCWDRLDSETKERYTVKPEDEDKAAAALYWAQELAADVGNDYLWNVRVVSYRERVSYREAGIAASIVVAYNRAMEKETAARYERDNPSQYFGTVGERSVYDVKVLSRKELIGEYGVTTLVVFRMADGNRAKWFASGEAEDFPLDAEVKVKATVKGHEEYRGAKQTVLSRVAVYVEKAKKEKAA
jgi:hypothetical protein